MQSRIDPTRQRVEIAVGRKNLGFPGEPQHVKRVHRIAEPGIGLFDVRVGTDQHVDSRAYGGVDRRIILHEAEIRRVGDPQARHPVVESDKIDVVGVGIAAQSRASNPVMMSIIAAASRTVRVIGPACDSVPNGLAG